MYICDAVAAYKKHIGIHRWYVRSMWYTRAMQYEYISGTLEKKNQARFAANLQAINALPLGTNLQCLAFLQLAKHMLRYLVPSHTTGMLGRSEQAYSQDTESYKENVLLKNWAKIRMHTNVMILYHWQDWWMKLQQKHKEVSVDLGSKNAVKKAAVRVKSNNFSFIQVCCYVKIWKFDHDQLRRADNHVRGYSCKRHRQAYGCKQPYTPILNIQNGQSIIYNVGIPRTN